MDMAPLLPSALTAADVTALLARVPQLCRPAGAAGKAAGDATPAARVVAETCVVSGPLMDALKGEVQVAARGAAERALSEKKEGPAAAGKAGAAQVSGCWGGPVPLPCCSVTASIRHSCEHEAAWHGHGGRGGVHPVPRPAGQA